MRAPLCFVPKNAINEWFCEVWVDIWRNGPIWGQFQPRLCTLGVDLWGEKVLSSFISLKSTTTLWGDHRKMTSFFLFYIKLVSAPANVQYEMNFFLPFFHVLAHCAHKSHQTFILTFFLHTPVLSPSQNYLQVFQDDRLRLQFVARKLPFENSCTNAFLAYIDSSSKTNAR